MSASTRTLTAKVLIVDSEFAKTVKEALAITKRRPLIIDHVDPVAGIAGERLGTLDYEELIGEGEVR